MTGLELGDVFGTKQMEATEGRLLPEHRASVESVLVVIDSECIVRFPSGERTLKQGASLVLPADEWHQIRANPDFKAVHVVPKEIRFEFSK